MAAMQQRRHLTDADILRWADALTKEYGPDAVLVAGMRAEERLEAGDMETYQAWKRVLLVLDDLYAEGPPPGASIH
jgi:hypothetical protein